VEVQCSLERETNPSIQLWSKGEAECNGAEWGMRSIPCVERSETRILSLEYADSKEETTSGRITSRDRVAGIGGFGGTPVSLIGRVQRSLKTWAPFLKLLALERSK
jgi:hypothetical protein